MHKYLSSIGIILSGILIVGCHGSIRGGGGACGEPCNVPVPSKCRDIFASIRFINAAGACPRIPNLDLRVDGLIRWSSVPFLLDDCDSKYNNCIKLGPRNLALTQSAVGGTFITYVATTQRLFQGFFTVFAYAVPPSTSSSSTASSSAGGTPSTLGASGAVISPSTANFIILSDDQSAIRITNSTAAVRVVNLSQRLAAIAGGGTDAYLQLCDPQCSPCCSPITNTVPNFIQVLQGGSSASVSNAVPNWTETRITNNQVVIAPGGTTFSVGGTSSLVGLSSYITQIPSGRYKLIVVVAGSGGQASGSLINGCPIDLAPNTYYTIVITDENNTRTGVCVRVYTDLPCCVPCN